MPVVGCNDGGTAVAAVRAVVLVVTTAELMHWEIRTKWQVGV